MRFESAVIQLLRFLVLSFFTFAVFIWYGALLILLLKLWIGLSEFLGEYLLGMTLGIPISFLIVGLFCTYVADKTRFFTVVEDVGKGLISMGVRAVATISGTESRSSGG